MCGRRARACHAWCEQLLRLVGEAMQSRRLATAAGDGKGVPAQQPDAAAASGEKLGGGSSRWAAKAGKDAGAAGASAPVRGRGWTGTQQQRVLSSPQQESKEQQQQVTAAAAGDGQQHCQEEATTLVVFDEADTLLDTDRGFLAALPSLIRDSRRPIVLCCNGPELPPGLSSSGGGGGARVQSITLLRPPAEELVRLLVLVATAEGSAVTLQHVRQLVSTHVSCRVYTTAPLHVCERMFEGLSNSRSSLGAP